MGSPSAAITRTSAASLSQGSLHAGAARRSAESASVTARPGQCNRLHDGCRIGALSEQRSRREFNASLPRLGVLPSPLWGGVGGGGQSWWTPLVPQQRPPSPT